MDINYGDKFAICFNMMKLRYADYSESLKFKNFLNPNDGINVFISFESVLKNISRIPDLEKRIVLERDFVTIIISNIINLIAHYSGFFRSNGLNTRIYLYMTSLDSNYFLQYKYNEDYRSYYLVKWNENPRFAQFTDSFKKDILPLTKTYLEFIPGAYFLDAKNMEGSMIPYVIARQDPSRKNLVISEDIYDSQYGLLDNFVMHYLHRDFKISYNSSTSTEYLKDLLGKEPKEIPTYIQTIFQKYALYVSLLSVLGDRPRSLDGVGGIKGSSMSKLLLEGVEKQIITLDTESPALLQEIFGGYEERKEEFDQNYRCCSIKMAFDELTRADCISLYNQQIDRMDVNSLMMLNRTVFAKYPLMLDRLL